MATVLTGHMTLSYQANFQKTATGYPNLTFQINQQSAHTYDSANNANSAGGADELYAAVITLGNSANVTLDLSGTNITNVFGTNIALARIKSFSVELISVAQNSTIGTNCTFITFGNAASNPAFTSANGWFANVSSSIRVPNGGWVAFSAGNANGTLIGSSNDSLFLNNEDSGNNAKIRLTAFGGLS